MCSVSSPLVCMLQEPIPTSLLKMSGEHMSRAVKMFSGILKYMGEVPERVDEAGRVEIAQKLLHQVRAPCGWPYCELQTQRWEM